MKMTILTIGLGEHQVDEMCCKYQRIGQKIDARGEVEVGSCPALWGVHSGWSRAPQTFSGEH